VPWRTHPKRDLDQVLDLLIAAPALYAVGDRLPSLPPSAVIPTTLEVVTKCWKLDAELQAIYGRLENSHPGPIYWATLARDDYANPADTDPKCGKLFPVAFHFPNLSMAQAVLINWSVQLMLWKGLTQLYDMLASFQYDLSKLPPLGHRRQFVEPARNICQGVEYCLRDEMPGWGPSVATAPLSIVAAALVECPEFKREVAWALEAMGRVHRQGVRIIGCNMGVREDLARSRPATES